MSALGPTVMTVCLPARPRKRRYTSSVALELLAVDREQEVALLHVHAGLGERRLELGVPVLARAGSARSGSGPARCGSRRRAGPRSRGPASGIAPPASARARAPGWRAPRRSSAFRSSRPAMPSSHARIELLGRREVEAVGVRVVEEVALDAPDLVVHLPPLGARIDPHLQALELLIAPSPVLRRGVAVPATYEPLLVLRVQDLLAVRRHEERRRSPDRSCSTNGSVLRFFRSKRDDVASAAGSSSSQSM